MTLAQKEYFCRLDVAASQSAARRRAAPHGLADDVQDWSDDIHDLMRRRYWRLCLQARNFATNVAREAVGIGLAYTISRLEYSCLVASRITRSLVTAKRPRSSPRTAPSTGSAGLASTRGRVLRRCWATRTMAVGGSRQLPQERTANVRLRRRYRRDTLILETEFTTADGRALSS